MPISEKKKITNLRWAKKAYEQIKISSRRELRLNELIDFAAAKTSVSKAQYIASAICERLERDKVSIDDLPPKGDLPSKDDLPRKGEDFPQDEAQDE